MNEIFIKMLPSKLKNLRLLNSITNVFVISALTVVYRMELEYYNLCYSILVQYLFGS